MLTSIFVFVSCSNQALESVNGAASGEIPTIGMTTDANEENKLNKKDTLKEESLDNDSFEGYRIIEADGKDQSGHKESNVIVDIDFIVDIYFGDKAYYAYKNDYGQLVKVTAKEIILQE